MRATAAELPAERAVAAYAYQLADRDAVDDGSMAIVAPEDAREDPAARAFLERVVASGGPGHAPCTTSTSPVDAQRRRPRVPAPARPADRRRDARALGAASSLDDALDDALCAWVDRHYRDRLVAADLADPALAREGMPALDELTALLGLGAVYDFQRSC